ncbi:hypothetical protein BDW72DRAFT_163693 [Aspergillus terricola var. indicus]
MGLLKILIRGSGLAGPAGNLGLLGRVLAIGSSATWLLEPPGHRELCGPAIKVAQTESLLLFEADSLKEQKCPYGLRRQTQGNSQHSQDWSAETCVGIRPTLKICLGFLHSYTKMSSTTMSRMSLINPPSVLS